MTQVQLWPRVVCELSFSRSQSDSEGFSPGTPVFLPPQNRLPAYSIRLWCCALSPGYDVKLQPGRGGEAVRGVSKSQLTSTKSAQMAGIIHSATGGLVGATKPSKPLYIVGMGKRSMAEPYG